MFVSIYTFIREEITTKMTVDCVLDNTKGICHSEDIGFRVNLHSRSFLGTGVTLTFILSKIRYWIFLYV